MKKLQVDINGSLNENKIKTTVKALIKRDSPRNCSTIIKVGHYIHCFRKKTDCEISMETSYGTNQLTVNINNCKNKMEAKRRNNLRNLILF